MTVSSEYALWNARRSTWADYDVVGSRNYLPAIARLFPRDWDRAGHEIHRDFALVPEPDNPYDEQAVSVRADGDVVGYIAHGDLGEWAPVVYRVAGSGCTATVPGRIWMVMQEDWGQLDWRGNPRTSRGAYVRIRLGEPELALPRNDPPAMPHTLLPRGGFVKVTQTQDHFDALFEHVPESGRGLLYATLHAETITTARSSTDVIEVRIDDEPIGVLTADMSKRFLPLVEHLRGRGLIPTCRAEITGSSVAAEVRIDAVKANEADDAVLDGPAVTVPALVAERPDPHDYDVPDAYRGSERARRGEPRDAGRETPPTPAAAPDAGLPPPHTPASGLGRSAPDPWSVSVDGHGDAPAAGGGLSGYPLPGGPSPVPRGPRPWIVCVLIVLGGIVLSGVGSAVTPALGSIFLVLTIPAAIVGTLRYKKRRERNMAVEPG